ncbi:hypothetical protein FOMPIDRAFT_1059303 [Fomitopsis schrenkii]|uniref:Uncharacterized protein n=1 Tax=Fomitopsis schrenkii TaxID=2126942 RepID=S8FVJ6_FOMSC|nr:hypothetical protein FOMPIDRAFT_1059303 [Fomitopsis schrenkii]
MRLANSWSAGGMAWLRPCLDIAGQNGHDARIPNPQTSPTDTSNSPPAIARIAGDGACKIAAWLSTLCAGSSDVEMVCVGMSKAPVYARIVGLPLSTSRARRPWHWHKNMPLPNLKAMPGGASPRNIEDACGAPAMEKKRQDMVRCPNRALQMRGVAQKLENKTVSATRGAPRRQQTSPNRAHPLMLVASPARYALAVGAPGHHA